MQLEGESSNLCSTTPNGILNHFSSEHNKIGSTKGVS